MDTVIHRNALWITDSAWGVNCLINNNTYFPLTHLFYVKRTIASQPAMSEWRRRTHCSHWLLGWTKLMQKDELALNVISVKNVKDLICIYMCNKKSHGSCCNSHLISRVLTRRYKYGRVLYTNNNIIIEKLCTSQLWLTNQNDHLTYTYVFVCIPGHSELTVSLLS